MLIFLDLQETNGNTDNITVNVVAANGEKTTLIVADVTPDLSRKSTNDKQYKETKKVKIL